MTRRSILHLIFDSFTKKLSVILPAIFAFVGGLAGSYLQNMWNYESRIKEERFNLKKEVYLNALNDIDKVLSSIKAKDWEPPPPDGYKPGSPPSIESSRATLNLLMVSSQNPEIIKTYMDIINFNPNKKGNMLDKKNHFINEVRRDLFGDKDTLPFKVGFPFMWIEIDEK